MWPQVWVFYDDGDTLEGFFFFMIKLDLLARLEAACPDLRAVGHRSSHTHTLRATFLSTRGIHSLNPELL